MTIDVVEVLKRGQKGDKGDQGEPGIAPAEVAALEEKAARVPDTDGASGQYPVWGPAGPGWQDEPVFNVKHPRFGAVGDSTTDDTAAVQAAIDAAEVAGGVVFFPEGDYDILTGPLIIDSNHVTLRGLGRSVSRLVAPFGTTDLFELNNSPYNLKFEHMGFAAVSGHVFTVETSLVHAEWFECACLQLSDSHAVLDVTNTAANYIDNLWLHCETTHTLTATVPTFNLRGSSINNNHWADIRPTNSGNYTWWIESTHASGGYAYGNVIERITGEVLNGGAVKVLGGHGTSIANFDVWDLGTTTRDLFVLDAATSSGTTYSKYTTMTNVRRVGGTLGAGLYDLLIGGGGGNTPTTLINCGGQWAFSVRDAARVTQIDGAVTFSSGAGITKIHGEGHQFSHPVTFSDRVKLASYTTASRPAAATAGARAVIFDTTLGLPIFSDGTNWKNFAGTVV